MRLRTLLAWNSWTSSWCASQRRRDAVLADEYEHRHRRVGPLVHAEDDVRAGLDERAIAKRHLQHRNVAADLDVGLLLIGRPVLDRDDAILDVVDPAMGDDALFGEIPLRMAHGDAAQRLVDDAQLDAAMQP